MSQGAATPGVAPPPLPMPEGPGPQGAMPANAQMVVPGGGAQNAAAISGSPISGILGKTASAFMDMMGDTPEERQQNLEAFTKVIGTVNQLGSEVGQTSLAQRLGKQHGVEMLANQQAQGAAANAGSMQPMSPMSPEAIAKMLQDVGLGVRGIEESTGRDIRR